MGHIIDEIGLHFSNFLLSECQYDCVEENYEQNESECESGNYKSYRGEYVILLIREFHIQFQLAICVGK